jgi:hypothetical protein
VKKILHYHLLTDGAPSDSDTWRDAFNADSVVCEAYAQTNQHENFAQMVNVVLYDQNAKGGIGTICSNCNKLSNQISAIEDHSGDTLKVGGTCESRLENSDAVSKDSPSNGGSTLSNGDIVLTSIPPTGDTAVVTAAPTTTTGHVAETFGSIYLTTPNPTGKLSGAAPPAASGGIVYELFLSFAAFLMFL